MVMTVLSIMCAVSLVWNLFLSIGMRALNQDLGKLERGWTSLSSRIDSITRDQKHVYERVENLDVELGDTALALTKRIDTLHTHWDEELKVIREWNATLQEYERRLKSKPVARVRKVKHEQSG